MVSMIYDRWGVKIYEWDSESGVWDGHTTTVSLASNGVYYFILNASSVTGDVIEEKGFVQLISEL